MLLEELLGIQGVVAAGEFTAEGEVVDYRTAVKMLPEAEQTAAQTLATMVKMSHAADSSYTQATGGRWMSHQARTYSQGDLSLVVGGDRAVVAETAKADFNELFEALMGD